MIPFDLTHQLIARRDHLIIDNAAQWQTTGMTLLLVCQGLLTMTDSSDESLTLNTGDIHIIPSPDKISLEPEGWTEIYILILRPEGIIDLTNSDDLFHIKRQMFQEAQTRALTSALTRISQLSPDTSGNPGSGDSLMTSSLLMEIIGIMSKATTDYRNQNTVSDKTGDSGQPLFREIDSYMKNHYNAGLAQGATAQHFDISPQYLARLIRQNTGLTFRGYLQQIREDSAQRYRSYTGLSQEEIDLRTAPDRYSHMPDASSQVPEIVGRMVPAGKLMDLSSNSSLTDQQTRQTKLTAATQFTRQTPDSWRRLINLGYASDLKNQQLEDLLERIQGQIGFTYGRICRIMDLVNRFSFPERSILDFSPALSILDTLIDNKITPFLELGNKSFTIQETTSMAFEPQPALDSETYFSHLLELLPEFLATCVNRYGHENVDSWRFEVSYNFTGQTHQEFSFSQFLRIFRKISDTIHQVVPGAKIGGPGFNRWDSPDQIRSVMEQMKRNNVVCDFMTAYLYPLNKSSDGTLSISEDPDLITHRLTDFVEASQYEFPGRQIWVTEFNSNLSSRNHLNDSTYQAVYIARALATAASLPVSAMGYYLLSDAPLRYSDSLDFLFGGWGLFTDTGLAKASWHTYDLFSMLGRYLLRTGPDYMITANSESSFQILLTHYRHLTQEYLRRNVSTEDLNDPDKVFVEVPDNVFRITLSPITAGDYILREYRIDLTNANLLLEWQRTGFLSRIPHSLLRDFASLSSLAPRISRITIKQDQPFVLRTTLDHLQVCFYSLELYSTSGYDSKKGHDNV